MKIGIPKGMRDFSPEVLAKRRFIFEVISKTFKRYGFEEIETPTMENRDTLTGKYGEEGDRLIFNVLNSGDYLKKADHNALSTTDISGLTPSIADKALRYDLTVPFARYVVQHQNEINFPFKRFQIQAVWRADRPQKGRYREFYQCDADVVGSESLLNEVEFVKIFDEVLSELGLNDFTIKINNRKILSGIAEWVGRPDQLINITVAIDKLEKIGKEKVMEELASKGLNEEEIQKIDPLFHIKGSNQERLSTLKKLMENSEIGKVGIAEIETVLSYLNHWSLKKAKVEVDLTLARGLNYYTGTIFEVQTHEVKMGSICGGGRYADLTGIFGLKDMPGVGISFGADRIFDVMEELDLFPKQLTESSKLLFINFGKEEAMQVLPILQKVREAGIAAEIYPDSVKLGKQFKYADKKSIPYVVSIGEEELKTNQYSLKDLASGEQEKVDLQHLINKLS